ncbi:immediate early protein IE1 [Human betaherpesvirus 6A]|uniref:Immediate-early protein 1 n=6 Tax=Roseolovirus TaxID=40272 RepID=IE1_HHV6U|nr:immediate early protein IE1 [Human betaherpesvirus 6A]Q69567.2 RecName: Full=Immediate-early protein 1; Short=IE1; AltName: Full=Protein RF2/RF3/RF4; AltName: Full=pRF2/pRF3/pRF4 [Human herpesvirus 6 (strain Uganda-1102)]CAA58339.2 immediate early protein IE1 [Human betaherpesvirus 6A]
MEPAKPSGNNMGSNDERMQDYRPDPMMEESIKEILEESLMCDTSFDDLIIPGLESFGLIIPESSNNIESNNVEEGSDGELKTLAAQSAGNCIQSIGASVKAAMKQEQSDMEDKLIKCAGLLTQQQSMFIGLGLEQLSQLININLLSSASTKYVESYSKMLHGKELDFFNWCEPRFIVFACDKFDGLVKKVASESRNLLLDLRANMNNDIIKAVKDIFSKATVTLDCQKLNQGATMLMMMAHNKEMSNPDISSKDFCEKINTLKQTLLEGKNEIVETNAKNMQILQTFAIKQMNQIFMDGCDKAFLKLNVNCKNLITAAKNLANTILQSIVICSNEFSWQHLKLLRRGFKVTMLNMITQACECLESDYDDTGLIKPLTPLQIMDGYINMNKNRQSSICDGNTDPSDSMILDLADFDDHGRYSEESSIESIHEDDDNKMYPCTPSPEVPGKSKYVGTFTENSRQSGDEQTNPNCVGTASVTDLGGPDNLNSISGLQSCKNMLLERLLDTQCDSVVEGTEQDGSYGNTLISEMMMFGYETDHSAPYESESDNNDEIDYIANSDSAARTNNIHMNSTDENTPFSNSICSPPEVTPSKKNVKPKSMTPGSKPKKRVAKRKHVSSKSPKNKKIKTDQLPKAADVIVISSESEDEEDGDNIIGNSILIKAIKSESDSESSSESNDCTSEHKQLHLSDYDEVTNNGHCPSYGFPTPVFTIPIRSMQGTGGIKSKFIPKKNWIWYMKKTHQVDNCPIHNSENVDAKDDSDGTEAKHCFMNHFVPIKTDDEDYDKNNVSYIYNKIQNSKIDSGDIIPTKKLIIDMVMDNFMDLNDIIKQGITKHCQDLCNKYNVVTPTTCEDDLNMTNSQTFATTATQVFDPPVTGNNSSILNIINDTTSQNDENRCTEGTSNSNEKCTNISDCNSDGTEAFKLDGYPSDYDPFVENAQIY